MSSFKIIRLLVLDKKIFERFNIRIYWHGGNLNNVTQDYLYNFMSPFPKQKLALIGPTVSEEMTF